MRTPDVGPAVGLAAAEPEALVAAPVNGPRGTVRAAGAAAGARRETEALRGLTAGTAEVAVRFAVTAILASDAFRFTPPMALLAAGTCAAVDLESSAEEDR